jgi:hypothetical protein
MSENSTNNNETKTPTNKEWRLEVTEEQYQAAKDKGIEEEALFKPGTHVFRRRDPNKVLRKNQTTVVLHLDEETFTYFQRRAATSGSKNIEAEINAELRALADKEVA